MALFHYDRKPSGEPLPEEREKTPESVPKEPEADVVENNGIKAPEEHVTERGSVPVAAERRSVPVPPVSEGKAERSREDAEF